MTATRHELPPIVSPEEWQAARDALLVKEKAHMKTADDLAAERRRLPMVPFDEALRIRRARGQAEPARPVRRPASARRLPLHAAPGHQRGGLPRLLDDRRQPAAPGAPARPDVTLKVVAPAPLARDRAVQDPDGLGRALGLRERHGVPRGLRRRQRLRHQRVPPRRRRRLPHVLHQRPRWRDSSCLRTATSTSRRWGGRRRGRRRATATPGRANGGACTTNTDTA